jgi:hypothetical protein
MMAAGSTSETSVNFYQATRRIIPEDSHVQALSCTVNLVNSIICDADELKLTYHCESFAWMDCGKAWNP